MRGRMILISVNSPGSVSTSIEPRVLLDDDIVADGEAESGAFSGRFGRKERIKHLVLNVRRNTCSVIPDRDFHPVAKVFGRGTGSACNRHLLA